MKRLDAGILANLKAGKAYPPSLEYPKPAKYTLSESRLEDPDLGYIAEHPKILDAVEGILGPEIRLTAYLAYLRTPHDNGAGAHHDYKRWRPGGSSMKWLFTIMPLTDFNDTIGSLMVAPGSHKLVNVIDTGARVLDVEPSKKDDLADFVDPKLMRGDLLLMDMYCWHRAPANISEQDRIGMFNKYCAADSPPAAGYFMFNDAVHEMFSERGKRLLAVHSDKEILTSRLIIERAGNDGPEIALVRSDDSAWEFPGGPGEEDLAMRGWDVGARIGSLREIMIEQYDLDVSWMSYIGDYDEGDGICRMYGYTLPEGTDFGTDSFELDWVSESALKERATVFGWEAEAVDNWLHAKLIRGKGKSHVQSQENQYA